MNVDEIKNCEINCRKLRKIILNISHLGKDGNLQSNFSAIDILWTLYDKILNISPDNLKNKDRDIFILSKGQASLGLYTVLAEKRFFIYDELNTFCKFDSRFGMQADRTKFDREIEISAGSLGHGFPMAVGVAIAKKIKKINSKVFTLVGDGEFNEGTMWEAALLAGYYKLNNLYLIIDDNSSIGSMLDMGDMKVKLESFGFKVIRIDGHNYQEIYNACTMDDNEKPLAIIANTIRGFGSESMMKNNMWFHKAPNEIELQMLIEEVDNFEKSNVHNCFRNSKK